ncbi:MAG TPA: phenylalanine--tRNA ligase subunit beta [Polyangia bacterium]|nr:phenylalanine--tRNA ligase subunit beta [Polyangia bacterium]
MKISFNWLRELVELPPGVTAEAVAGKLTLAGLEVESIDRRGRDLTGVVVAEVLAKRPHPGSDKLSIVRVRAPGVTGQAGSADGEEVVCGAPNVPAPGGLVAWAPPGATLPGGLTLSRKEVRGVSSPGMLCSEVELGISPEGDRTAGDGILILSPDGTARPGADVAGLLGVLDEIFEVNVTPNRPDALSHAGIAREVAALFETKWKLPAPDDVPEGPFPNGRGVDVEIRDPDGCPRYLARLVTGLRVGPSPIAMRVRLGACGVRAISNLVDVTNYVMLETGHPLHAFDLAKVSGDVQVRRANRGERMTTLDGVDRALQETDVVIADGKHAIALAGVMGGATSEVSDATTTVLLEAATFDPRAVRRTAKRLGLHSEASHRFERGVDANSLPHASARAAAMLARLGGGSLAGALVDRYPREQHPRTVMLSMAGLERLAGFKVPLAEAARHLESVEIAAATEPGDGPAALGADVLVATVPTFRPDITIEEDLIEEVMRLHGYDRAPARLPARGRAPSASPEALADHARETLAALGLHEAVTWAFVPRTWLRALGGVDDKHPLADGVVVKNPISADYEVMRTSLLPGLVEATKRNLARGVADVALFEVGPIVRRTTNADAPTVEPTHAAAIWVGRRAGWLKPGEALDFFDAKRAAVSLLRGLGVADPVFRARTTRGPLHPGVGADVFADADAAAPIGFVGELDPRLARALGLDARALYLEIELDGVAGAGRPVRSAPTPRFPSATRDVSFWIDVAVSADAQRAALTGAKEPLLRDLAVLEDFRDPKYAPPGQKGMLWTLTYRADDRTLTDAEVDAAHGRAVAALEAAHAIGIR